MARGNFEMDIEWKNGKMTKAIILSKSGGNCKLLIKEKIRITGTKSITTSKSYGTEDYFFTIFPTVAGKKYEVLIK